MRPLGVVAIRPGIQVALQFLHSVVDLLAKGYGVEFVLDGLVEPLLNPVGLEMLGLGPAVVDII